MSVTHKEDSIKKLKEEKQKVAKLEAENEQLSQQVTDLQLALCDVYELILGGGL